MKMFERICLRDWFIEAENGDRQELRRGKTYTTSRPWGDGTLTVYSSFWVRVPVDVFEPWSDA